MGGAASPSAAACQQGFCLALPFPCPRAFPLAHPSSPPSRPLHPLLGLSVGRSPSLPSPGTAVRGVTCELASEPTGGFDLFSLSPRLCRPVSRQAVAVSVPSEGARQGRRHSSTVLPSRPGAVLRGLLDHLQDLHHPRGAHQEAAVQISFPGSCPTTEPPTLEKEGRSRPLSPPSGARWPWRQQGAGVAQFCRALALGSLTRLPLGASVPIGERAEQGEGRAQDWSELPRGSCSPGWS